MESENYSRIFLFLAFIMFFTISYLYKRRLQPKKKYLNDKLPYLSWAGIKLPLIEGLITLWLVGNHGTKILDEAHSKLGKTYKCHVMFLKLVVTSDVKVLQKLLSSTAPTHLSKPETIYKNIFSDIFNKGLLCTSVSVWKPHRKAVSPAFTYKMFPTYLEYITKTSQEMASCACELSELKSTSVVENAEMKKLIDLAAVQIITNIIKGPNTIHVPPEESVRFYASMDSGKETYLDRFLKPELFILSSWKHHPKSKIFLKAVDDCRLFANMIIKMYRPDKITMYREDNNNNELPNIPASETEESNRTKTPNCLIEHMLNSEMTKQEISDQVATFMEAGHETIVAAIDFLLFHLAKHPEYQQLCQEEVDGVFNWLDERGKLTMENLSELKFLERCALESMRLTPPVPAFARQLGEDLEIGDGSVLEAGTTMLVDTWSTHRDPKFYPDPDKFDPDRFLPENVKLRPYHAYLPFSLGPRNCIGYRIALMETKVIVAYILRNFEMTTTDSIDDVNLIVDVTLKPERMYNIQFKRRLEN